MTGFLWLLLLLGLLFASLPFVADKTFLGLPVLKQDKKMGLRLFELVCAYGLFVLCGRLLEGSVTQVKTQGWAFYAVTALFFIVAAAPAFIWRYLWKR
ncbi:DUF2818 family protein [Hydromonas duriensis]|uniref:Uncharacterized protein DUF2818 n=1 Tax=Hydromonas duriensis TaxID=1527608 RepID=A0A4R6Y947_9BURK|nr:DUF2818 family protein [Hydromonas duriensis]TDR31943.1 uncharacterized protein DUF2818 [Hydromonas duriensis]